MKNSTPRTREATWASRLSLLELASILAYLIEQGITVPRSQSDALDLVVHNVFSSLPKSEQKRFNSPAEAVIFLQEQRLISSKEIRTRTTKLLKLSTQLDRKLLGEQVLEEEV